MPPQRVGFLRCFVLKTGIDFVHFGLESGMVFQGTTGVCEKQDVMLQKISRMTCFSSKDRTSKPVKRKTGKGVFIV